MKKRTIGLAVFLPFLLTSIAFASSTSTEITVNRNPVLKLSYNNKIVTPGDSNGMIKNGDANVPFALTYNGATYVPLRYLTQLFGGNIKWDANSNLISISDKTDPATVSIDPVQGSIVSLKAAGPTDWSQYRLDNTNNAVYNGGVWDLDKVYKTDNQVRSTPAVVGKTLFVGNQGGSIYSIDLTTSMVNWQAKAPNWIHSETLYHDGKIYVGFGNRDLKYDDSWNVIGQGSGENGVLALDAKTGKILWKFNTLGSVMPTPNYYNGTLYITTGDSHLYAVNPTTGNLIWSIQLPGIVSMSDPKIMDNILYVGSSNSLVAVDLQTRKIIWQQPNLGSVLDIPPAISPDGIITITGVGKSNNFPQIDFNNLPTDYPWYHFIYAFDAKSGKLLWRDLLGTGPDQEDNTSGAPTIYKDYVLVGSPYTKTVYCYNWKTGQRVWSFKVGYPVKGAPAVIDHEVIFGDGGGNLYAFELETGKKLVSKNIGGKFAPGGVSIINRTIIIGNQNNNIYAIPLDKLLLGKS